MPGFLRQATASQSRALGPFIDDTDFKTPKTALTIANTDVKLVVNGGASANKNSGGGTHRVNGVYGVTFDATDTATVGEMEVNVLVSGALIVFDKFTVVEETIYDALYAASAPGYLQSATAGRTLVVDANGLADATAVKLGPTGAATALTARDIGTSVLLSSGTGTGQLKLASGYVAMTWADIAAPTTTVVLSGTTVGVLTTYTGNTPQTGDSFARIGAAGAGLTALGDTRIANLDATVSSRMATYTQPTGFLSATFPSGTIANTTNITAGTITTTTNLTNAATAGDFTATMKTSIGTAVAASAVASVTAPVSITGDFSATMKTSIGTAVAASAVASVTAPVTVGTNNDKTGYRLSATGVDDVWDEVVEGTYTARQYARLFGSALGGTCSGMATATGVFRDTANTKDRITVTQDASGNRAAITLDLT